MSREELAVGQMTARLSRSWLIDAPEGRALGVLLGVLLAFASMAVARNAQEVLRWPWVWLTLPLMLFPSAAIWASCVFAAFLFGPPSKRLLLAGTAAYFGIGLVATFLFVGRQPSYVFLVPFWPTLVLWFRGCNVDLWPCPPG